MYPIFFALQHLTDSCRVNKALFNSIKWFGNFWFYLGALLVSISTELALYPLVFVTFLLGHILWMFAGATMKDNPLFFQNLLFIPIDIWAITIRL